MLKEDVNQSELKPRSLDTQLSSKPNICTIDPSLVALFKSIGYC